VQGIEPFVTEQLASWEVPGCAAAAVRGGDVALSAGWGRRDLESDLPVTPDTLFAIGSTTKAFTATTVGALVDEGLLGLEPLDWFSRFKRSRPSSRNGSTGWPTRVPGTRKSSAGCAAPTRWGRSRWWSPRRATTC
jgi:hypothetical protein